MSTRTTSPKTPLAGTSRVSQPTSAARRKTTRLEARLTDAQKSLIQEAAELRGQTLTEFVVRAGEDAAAQVLERAGVVVLSAPDSAAFVDALLDAPPPNAKLRAAAARHQHLLGPAVADAPAADDE